MTLMWFQVPPHSNIKPGAIQHEWSPFSDLGLNKFNFQSRCFQGRDCLSSPEFELPAEAGTVDLKELSTCKKPRSPHSLDVAMNVTPLDASWLLEADSSSQKLALNYDTAEHTHSSRRPCTCHFLGEREVWTREKSIPSETVPSFQQPKATSLMSRSWYLWLGVLSSSSRTMSREGLRKGLFLWIAEFSIPVRRILELILCVRKIAQVAQVIPIYSAYIFGNFIPVAMLQNHWESRIL